MYSLEAARRDFPDRTGYIDYCSSAYEAAQGTDALLIVTEWDEFRKLDLMRLRNVMEVPVIIDGRNLLDPDAVRSAGFEYVDMGHRTHPQKWAAEGVVS